MSEPHIEVSRKSAAKVTEATDPDVARILAEDLAARDTSGDTESDIAEKMPLETLDGAGA
jgi:hypothetical protein